MYEKKIMNLIFLYSLDTSTKKNLAQKKHQLNNKFFKILNTRSDN